MRARGNRKAYFKFSGNSLLEFRRRQARPPREFASHAKPDYQSAGGCGGFTRRRLTRTKRDRAYLATRNIDHRRRFRLRYRALATYGIRHQRETLHSFSPPLSLSLFQLGITPPKSVRALMALAWKNMLIHPLPRGCALKRLTIQYFQKPISR